MASDVSLMAVFGGNTAPLEQSIKRASAAVADFTSRAAKNGFGNLISPIAKVAATVGSVGAIGAGLKGALDLGGELTDLSNRTGVAIESLYGLRQGFKDAGVDANALGPAVNKMQKALSSAASGGSEGNVLRAMGLDPQSLASMDPGKAFAEIGNAIASLPNSTERAAASMAIFGKSGAELLQVFMDPNFRNVGNISETAKLLAENAGVFDKAGDALGRVGPKLQGLFVGMASGMTGILDALADAIDGFDLSAWGKQIGDAISGIIEIFKQGTFTEIVSTSLKIAFEDALGSLKEGMNGIFGTNFTVGSSEGDRLRLAALLAQAGDAVDANNAQAQAANASRNNQQGAFNPAEIGQEGQNQSVKIAAIVSDSLAKVGGGGIAVGQSNPILSENKRQTSLQMEMVNLLKRMTPTTTAQFAT